MAELYPPFEVEVEKEKIAREFQINSRKVLKLIYSYQFIRLRITNLSRIVSFSFDIFYTMSATLNYFLKLFMNIVHRTYFATLFIIWPFGLNGLIYDEAISVK